MKQNVFFNNDMFTDYENLLFSVKNQCDSAFSLVVDCFSSKENKSLEMLFMLREEIDNNVIYFDCLTYKIINKENSNSIAFYLWFYFDLLNYFVNILKKIIDISKYIEMLDPLKSTVVFSKVIDFVKSNKNYFDKILGGIFNLDPLSDLDSELSLLINSREILFQEIIDLYSDNENFNNIINLVKNLSLILESHIVINYKYAKFIKVVFDVK